MAYDSNITSSILNLQIKSRIFRVDFQRPPIDGDKSLSANSFIQQVAIDATPNSPTSGSIISSTQWLINLTKPQILNLPGANTFFNNLINLITDLKTEYDASGSLATGSISQLSN